MMYDRRPAAALSGPGRSSTTTRRTTRRQRRRHNNNNNNNEKKKKKKTLRMPVPSLPVFFILISTIAVLIQVWRLSVVVHDDTGTSRRLRTMDETTLTKAKQTNNNNNEDDNRHNDHNNDNDLIPGTFWNGKLRIVGVRLTTSYQPSDQSVYFDMFGLHVGEEANSGFQKLNEIKPAGRQELTYRQATQQNLFCSTTTSSKENEPEKEQQQQQQQLMIPMTIIPSETLDFNSRNVSIHWRCDISKQLTKSQLLQQTKTRVVVYAARTTATTTNTTTDTNNNSPAAKQQQQKPSILQEVDKEEEKAVDVVLRVDIPTDTASLGHAGPIIIKAKGTGTAGTAAGTAGSTSLSKSISYPSFLHQVAKEGPMSVILCVGGINKRSLQQNILPEFIQHHINLGVDQIYLGVHACTPQHLEFYVSRLQYYIDLGIVVLGYNDLRGYYYSSSDSNNTTRALPQRDSAKVRFYNSCLYHAKGLSEYVVNLDVDELWLPPLTIPSPQQIIQEQEEEARQWHGGHDHHHNNSSSNSNNNNNKVTMGKQQQLTAPSTKSKTKFQEQFPFWKGSIYEKVMSLPEAAQSIRGGANANNDCSSWCFYSFPSYNIWKPLSDPSRKGPPPSKDDYYDDIFQPPKYKGFYGYEVRDRTLNRRWQKPILRTTYNYQSSFHVGGSCSKTGPPPPGNNITSSGSSSRRNNNYVKFFEDCPHDMKKSVDAARWGRMHHYYTLFRRFNDSDDEGQKFSRTHLGTNTSDEFLDLDEYNLLFRPIVIQQLMALQKDQQQQLISSFGKLFSKG